MKSSRHKILKGVAIRYSDDPAGEAEKWHERIKGKPVGEEPWKTKGKIIQKKDEILPIHTQQLRVTDVNKARAGSRE